jgi:hypothetical protein
VIVCNTEASAGFEKSLFALFPPVPLQRHYYGSIRDLTFPAEFAMVFQAPQRKIDT